MGRSKWQTRLPAVMADLDTVACPLAVAGRTPDLEDWLLLLFCDFLLSSWHGPGLITVQLRNPGRANGPGDTDRGGGDCR